MAIVFPAAGGTRSPPPGGRELCELVTQDRASVHLSIAKPYFIFPCGCPPLWCCTALAAGWAKVFIAGCRQRVLVMGQWGRGTPHGGGLVPEQGLFISSLSAGMLYSELLHLPLKSC